MARTPRSDTMLLSDGTEINLGGSTETATIAASAAVSGIIDKRGRVMMAVHVPATITAASLGLKAATASDGTFGPVYDKDGNLYTLTMTAGAVLVLDPQIVAALRYVKLWSQNGSGVDTNQGGARVFGVSLL